MLTSLIMVMLFPWILVSAQKCRQVYSQTNLKLQGHVIKSLPKPESPQCIGECASHGKCHSINFYQHQGICELNAANHLSNPESLVYSYGSSYLNYIERPVAKCSNKLCSEPLTCKLVDGGLDYKCEAPEVLHFPRKSIDDKVVLENPFNNLTAFTVALWMQADPSTDVHAPFSYARKSGDANEILFHPQLNVDSEFAVRNQLFKSSLSIIDGNWHHLCLTWANSQGDTMVYLDGVLKKQVKLVAGRVIGQGAIVLGQDQDSYMGGFEQYQSFQGNLTSVNMWDKVLTAQEISDLAKSCTEGEGNMVKWSDLKDKGEGDVKLIQSSTCGL